MPTFVIIFRVKGGVGKGSSPKAGGAAKGGAGSTGSTGGTGGDENYSYDDEEEDYDDAAEEGSGKTILFLLILFVSPLFWDCAKYFCRQLKKDQVNRQRGSEYRNIQVLYKVLIRS